MVWNYDPKYPNDFLSYILFYEKIAAYNVIQKIKFDEIGFKIIEFIKKRLISIRRGKWISHIGLGIQMVITLVAKHREKM